MRTTLLLLTLPLLAAPLAARQSPPPPPPTRTLEETARLRAELERLRETEMTRAVASRAESELRARELLLSGRDRDELLSSQRAMLESRLQGTLGAMTLDSELTGQRLMELQDRLRTTESLAERALTSFAGERHDRTGGLASLRPQQGTPEDSLYRLARETLNRGEYGRAAQLFQSFQERYPTTRSAPAALYYRAFALYRAGATTDLRNALAALEAQRSRYPATADDADAAALRVRINGALASRGDQQAAAAVRAASAAGQTCDREEMDVRAEALSALAHQDEAAAGAILGRVLAQRDDCSATLRRRAVYQLGRRNEPDVATRLLEVARNDPDRSVRSDAIAILGRMPGDGTVRNLEQVFNASDDSRTQGAVLSALRNNPSPEANRLLRRYVERTDLSDGLRTSAVNAMTGGAGFSVGSVLWAPDVATASGIRLTPTVAPLPPEQGLTVGRVTPDVSTVSGEYATVLRASTDARREVSEEDAAFLRGVYAKESSRQVKEAILGGLARAGGAANDGWLMSIVRNDNEESRYRSSALSRMRSERFPLSEIVRLYDNLTDRQLRSSVISVLGAREDDAATDKLVDIIRNGTDPRLRTEAISALTRKKDPRSTQILLDLLGR